MGTGSTISPMGFAAQATGMPRCVKGSVGASADYSGTAMIGFNINEGPGSMTGGIKPSKAGVTVEIAKNSESPLRVQVKSGGSPEVTWCASLTGTGGFVPWTAFNTMCRDGKGMAYNNEPLAGIMVLVPGGNMAAIPFDFCVNSIAESDVPAGTGTGGHGQRRQRGQYWRRGDERCSWQRRRDCASGRWQHGHHGSTAGRRLRRSRHALLGLL